MKKRNTLPLHIIAFIIWVISIILILNWFDWKLLVVLITFLWANNLSNRATAIDDKNKGL